MSLLLGALIGGGLALGSAAAKNEAEKEAEEARRRAEEEARRQEELQRQRMEAERIAREQREQAQKAVTADTQALAEGQTDFGAYEDFGIATSDEEIYNDLSKKLIG
jgi:predicted phage gp36 major capsid-like protein